MPWSRKTSGRAQLARYVHKNGNFATYQNTEVTFFPLGEDKFAAMLTELERAEQFHFYGIFHPEGRLYVGENSGDSGTEGAGRR